MKHCQYISYSLYDYGEDEMESRGGEEMKSEEGMEWTGDEERERRRRG